MSTTIDQRVVEMRFDNQHFEKNVSTTMSTLEKLKQKLHLDGASKGLENINAASKNVKMDGLGSAVETVTAKFSALQVIGTTALANITNSAVNAGKRILSALTIDPVKTGFSEYEMKMDSIKTIVNSTGRDLPDVNRLLEELNEYSDQTIYSFKDMTQNIGKFTNAGVNLEDAVLAIKGISNEAAVSGANAQEASRAMYNFSQALSAGYVKLIDWKSIENANMATKEFKQQLIDTAVELGVVTQKDDMYITSTGKAFNSTKNFNDVLQEQWMTTDVLITTLGKYADENTDIGKKAFAAAQEVTKLTQMWDVLKETAQSGWAKTWETILGDLNSAKAVFTPLTEFFSNIITTFDDARNRVLEIALNFTKPWTAIMDKLGGVKKVIDTVKSATGALEDFQHVVFRVWMGDYNNQGDNPDRRDLLKAAGYDARVVQYLVNKGFQYKLTMEDVEEAHAKFGLTMASTTDETKKTTSAIEKLSDETLKNAGLTEEEIRLYRALETEADRLDISMSKLADDMTNTSGRTLLIDSFKNFGDIFVGIGKAAKEAWINIFNPPSVEVLGVRLYGALRSLKEFTEKLRLTDKDTGKLNETGEKVLRTLKGVFAILDVITTILGSGFKIAFKVVSGILKYFNLDILELTAMIGDALVKFHDWFESLFDISWLLDSIVPAIDDAVTAIKDWFKAFKASEGVSKAIKTIEDFIDSIKEWWATLGESENLPKTIAEGIVSFFSTLPDVISEALGHVWDGLKETLPAAAAFDDWLSVFMDTDGLAKTISYIKGVTESIRDWWDELKNTENLPQAILDGFVRFISGIPTFIKTVFTNIRDAISESLTGDNFADTTFGKLISNIRYWMGIVGQTLLELGKILLRGVNKFLTKHGFKEISEESIAGLVEGLKDGASKVWNTAVEIAKTLLESVKNFLGIHSPSTKFIEIGKNVIEGFLEGLQNFAPKLWETIKSISSRLVEYIKNIDFGTVLAGVIGIGTTVATVKLAKAAEGFVGIGETIAEGVGSVLMGTTKVLNSFSKVLKGIAMESLGKTVKNFAIALGILVAAIVVLAYVCGNDRFDIWTAVKVVGALAAVLVGIAFAVSAMSKAAVNIGKDGVKISNLTGGLISIGAALLLVALTVKMIGNMDPDAMKQGFIGLAGVFVAIIGVMAACKLLVAKDITGTAAKVGKTVLQIGLAMLVLAVVLKMIARMEWSDMGKAFVGMYGLVTLITLLIVATSVAGPHADKVGGTMLKIAVAMGVLVLVAKMIAGMEWSEMGKAAVGLTGFVAIISLLILVTRLAGKDSVKIAGTILGISTAIMMMAMVARMLGGMDTEKLKKGTVMVAIFSAIIVGILAATKMIGKDANKAALTLLGVAVVIGIMAVITVILGMLSIEQLAKGIVAVGLLSAMIAGLIIASRGAADVKGTLIGIAIVIAVIVASIAALAMIEDPKKLIAPVASMIAIMGMLALMLKASSGIGHGAKSIATLTSLAGIIIILAGIILLLNDKLDDPVSALAKVGTLAVLLLSLSAVLFALSNMKVDANVWKGIGALAALSVLVLGLGAILWIINKLDLSNAEANVKSISALLIVLTAVLGGLTVIAKVIAYSGKEMMLGLAVALVGIAALGLIVLELGWVLSKISSMNIGDVRPALESILTLLVVLTVVLAALSGLGVILASGGSFIASGGLLVALLGIAILGVIVEDLAGVVSRIDKMNIGDVKPALTSIITVLVTLTAVLAVLTVLSPLLSVTGVGLAAAIVGIAALGLVVLELGWVLSKINAMDLSNAESNITVLSKLLYTLTNILVPLTILGIAGPIALNSIVAMAALGLVVWELGAILHAMREYDLKNASSMVETISALMYAMTNALIPLTIIGIFGPAALAGVAILGVLAVEIGLLMWGLSAIKDTETAKTNVNTVISLLRAISDVITEIAEVGLMSVIAVAAMAGLMLVVDKMAILLGAIGALASLFGDGIENAIEKGIGIFKIVAKGLGEIIVSFLSGLTSGLDSIAEDLSAFAMKIIPFILVMTMVTDSVATGAGNLAKAILAILASDFIATIVSAFSAGNISMTSLAEDLSGFAKGVGPFMEAMSGFDSNAAVGVEALCGAINALTNANIKDALVNLLPGDNSLSSFGENISAFATCIKDAAIDLAGITDDDVANIKRSAEAGMALAELNKAIPAEGGLWQKIAGTKDLSSWGNKIAAFADCIIMYSDKVAGKAIDSDAIKKSAEAATPLSELNDSIPRDGGVWQDIAGSKDLSTWGTKIVAFADALIAYSSKITGSTIDVDAIKKSAEGADALAEVNKKIPTSGGLWQLIAGEKNMTAFGAGLSSLATGILDYANAAVQIDDTKIAAITKSGEAVDKLKEVSDKLPDSGGAWGKLWGEKDPMSFGAGISTLANGINDCITVSSTITDDKVTAIGKMSDAITKIEEVFADVPDVNTEYTAAFKTAVNDLNSTCSTMNTLANAGYDFTGLTAVETGIDTISGMLNGLSTSKMYEDFVHLKMAVDNVAAISKAIAGLSCSYSGVDALKTAIDKLSDTSVDGIVDAFDGKAESVQKAIESMATAIGSTLSNSAGTVGESATEVASAIVDAFKSKYEDAKTAGVEFVAYLKEGIGLNGSTVFVTGNTVGNMAAMGLKTCYEAMKEAGKYLVTGFSAGIDDKTWYAEARAKAMAKAAIKAAKAALDINSPSKVFRAIGYSVPEGFAMGIDRMSGMVINASAEMSNSAIDNVKNSIAKIADAINTDIDAQPTIRPVMDLSDVRSGTSAIGDMLNVGSTIGVRANVSSISSMMSGRGFSATNDDVVSAIDKLRKDLGNVGSTTYNVNGVTYDDGSNVSSAIQSLVRYAKIERRV